MCLGVSAHVGTAIMECEEILKSCRVNKFAGLIGLSGGKSIIFSLCIKMLMV